MPISPFVLFLASSQNINFFIILLRRHTNTHTHMNANYSVGKCIENSKFVNCNEHELGIIIESQIRTVQAGCHVCVPKMDYGGDRHTFALNLFGFLFYRARSRSRIHACMHITSIFSCTFFSLCLLSFLNFLLAHRATKWIRKRRT